MSFKVADGYVEVHGRHDRASTRRNAKEAVDDSERIAKDREGSMLRWLFKTNPKLMRALEAPIGSIFGSPIIFAAAATAAVGLVGFLATAVTTALLTGIAAGFIGLGAYINKKALVDPWNNMVKDVEGVFKRASAPIVKPLIGAINMIGPAFKRMEPTLTRIYTALAPLIEPFTGGLLGFIEAMLPGIERAMPGIQVVVLELAKHLPGLGTAIGDMFATLAENGPLLARVVGLMITWLENFFKVAGPILVFWMKGFAFWADAWNNLTDSIKKGMQWLSETWAKIPGWWNASWGAVKRWFGELWDDISGFFSDTGSGISKWWNDQISQISGWWSQTWGAVSTWFQELPGKIGGFLSALPGQIVHWFEQARDMVFYTFGFMLGTLVNNVATFPGRAWALLQQGFALWKEGITTLFTWIVNTITSSWDRAIKFWSTVPGKVHNFILDMGRRVVTAVASMFASIMMWWDQLPGRLLNSARNAWNQVIGIFNWARTNLVQRMGQINTQVIAAIAGLGARLWNVGQDAIRGLINGIQSMMQWAVNQAWHAARKIAEGFMDALHIGSPSKYMADNVGKWIPKGIAVGIEDNMGDLDKIAHEFPDTFSPMARMPVAGNTTTDSSTNYGGVTIEVHIDNLQELEDIKAFLDGKMRNNPKASAWAGNLYEQQGEYERSYR